ncbi:MAG: polysaccharide deacetylase family protein [Sarcina sp.]
MKRKALAIIMTITTLTAGVVTINLMNSKNDNLADNLMDTKGTVQVKAEEVKKCDYNIVKNGNIIESAKDYATSAEQVKNIINGKTIDDKKEIYLTFDDGPSEYTNKVLDILTKYDVHATFFVLGESLENKGSDEILKNTILKGHAIANHTYTHDYKKLYKNGNVDVDYFMEELEKTNNKIKEIICEDFDTSVIRMPGGYMTREYYNDKNLDSFNEKLKDKNIVEIDWTSENGDGVTRKESVEQMFNRVLEQTKEQKKIILLMHDSKGKDTTIATLPKIIEHFKDQGYEFKVIGNNNIF